ncbi:unnamed protein product [Vitrella brassicaformis CCMP3155]|uniref:Nucleotide-diphospho-sugar transferase domain-containing protein n=2 Tax=Vitrella brassicaformis TaxID=1169539 RepID=A0A0G4EGU3_VITBC|nr:unnamed protein product [Vitrella brassicaformis CCMP3155]|eukprot:CEL94725.1 unnamed protein product [Vitrella brassicaformis CCMP3155]
MAFSSLFRLLFREPSLLFELSPSRAVIEVILLGWAVCWFVVILRQSTWKRRLNFIRLAAFLSVPVGMIGYSLMIYAPITVPKSLRPASRVLIYQFYTHGAAEYSSHSEKMWREYAALHGYDYVLFTDTQNSQPIEQVTTRGMNLNFAKLFAFLELQRTHPGVEFFFYVDTDTGILDPSIRIEDLVEYGEPAAPEGQNEPPRYMLMMPNDCPHSWSCMLRRERPNAGVMIMRNTATTREIVKKWLKFALSTCKDMARQHPPSQNVLWQCVMPLYRPFIRVVHYSAFHGWDGMFLRHLSSHDDARRAAVLTDMERDMHRAIKDIRKGKWDGQKMRERRRKQVKQAGAEQR